MATLEQLKWILGKTPKRRSCGPGRHTEVIQHPQVPPGEEDPLTRVEAMRLAGTNKHEIKSALHNIHDGSICHGSQLSRDLTPEEKLQRKNGNEQKIFAVCIVCHDQRELDQAPADDATVEAKDLKTGWGDPAQRANNMAFAKNGGKVTYKLPAGHANGTKGRAIRESFREIGAHRNLAIIAI